MKDSTYSGKGKLVCDGPVNPSEDWVYYKNIFSLWIR